MSELDWIYSLKDDVFSFMEKMKSYYPGQYRYAFKGDLIDEKKEWNVGASAFALKIYYVLGKEKDQTIVEACEYIKKFYKNNEIADTYLMRKGVLRYFLSALKNKRFHDLFFEEYKRAETRQSLSSLSLYEEYIPSFSPDVPLTENSLDQFFSKLNWNTPWKAGSHFSHLMFFYRYLNKIKKIDEQKFHSLTNLTLDKVNKLYHQREGLWYKGDCSSREKVNGAMKVISGMLACDKLELKNTRAVIDLCLNTINDETACDNFNIIYVLKYALAQSEDNYRVEEIRDFASAKLCEYKEHYFKNEGGFSFLKGRANDRYYGVKISKGLCVPDVHGTVMFLWGISIISQILGVNERLKFREYLT